MKTKFTPLSLFVLGSATLLIAMSGQAFAAETDKPDIRIERQQYDELGFPKAIPVSISGFSGEVDSTLKTDLLFMGIANVSPDQAKFLITGSNAGRVEGRLVEKVNRNQLLAKAYTGNTPRAQAHAFADDIAQVLTGKSGIAQTKLAFKVEAGRGRSEIYIADYDGQNAKPATKDNTLVAAPCWAGRDRLYYVSYKLGGPNVFTHQLSSGARTLITPFSGSSMSPAVSPDGRRLAMILSKSGSPDLYVSDLNGSNLKQLTSTREAESSPCWSPDSQTICFVSRDRGPASLYTISASGGTMRRILTSGTPNPTEPDWSPDGRWIIFTSQMRDFQICLVKAEGGDARVLVPGEDPTWAPNSRAVIFCKGPDHGKRLSLLDVPSKQVKDVPRILESNSQPSWGR